MRVISTVGGTAEPFPLHPAHWGRQCQSIVQAVHTQMKGQGDHHHNQ